MRGQVSDLLIKTKAKRFTVAHSILNKRYKFNATDPWGFPTREMTQHGNNEVIRCELLLLITF